MQTGEVSALLLRIQSGDRAAEPDLLKLLYADLRRMAAHQMRQERSDHTLQPTALVHEFYIRTFGEEGPRVQTRNHFMALAAQAMRHLLVDRARNRRAQKRGGEREQVQLAEFLIYDERLSGQFLAVHEALEKLHSWAPRQSQIVEMRFFGGMSEDEIAQHLGISSRTVKRDWSMARAWLHGELTP